MDAEAKPFGEADLLWYDLIICYEDKLIERFMWILNLGFMIGV